jgi:ABC-type sugar transport system substrate-binding protein
MRSTLQASVLGLALLVPGMTSALAQQSEFGPAGATETYYWISNKANLPLFVQYDYVGMEKIANELGVKVRVAGPTDFDLPGFIAAVDQVCAQKPAGVAVVGGWDPSLTESVKKCMAMGVPTVDSESGAGIVRALQEAGKKPGEVKVTAMEQTPDFFKTAADGWVGGIIVQNRELFIYYAIKTLYEYNHNGLKTSGLAGADGGVPVPQSIDTGVLLVTKDNVAKILAAAGMK